MEQHHSPKLHDGYTGSFFGFLLPVIQNMNVFSPLQSATEKINLKYPHTVVYEHSYQLCALNPIGLGGGATQSYQASRPAPRTLSDGLVQHHLGSSSSSFFLDLHDTVPPAAGPGIIANVLLEFGKGSSALSWPIGFGVI